MAKRSNGEGMIRQRADGRWESRVMIGYKDNGKPDYKSVYGKTKKEAREKLKVFLDERASGIDTSHNYNFSNWADIWFEHHQDNITATTQENYRYTLRILKDYFGVRPLADIKAFDIEVFLKALRKEERSDSCIAQCRGMLYQIFHKAEANDLVRKNPVRFADKMRSREPTKRKEAFTAEEVKLLMEKLPKDRIGISIRLLLGTGMRSQELLALEPRHIAEDGSLIQIRQAVNMVKGTATVGQPKSRDSYRDVPIPPNLRWCAIQLRTTNRTFVWEAGKKDQPCNPSYFRDKFKAAIGEIEGVRVLTPHSCRHTYVSQLQALGVDLPTIQSIVGHADIDMTQHYLHVQDSIRQKAVSKFAAAFGGEEYTLDSLDATP